MIGATGLPGNHRRRAAARRRSLGDIRSVSILPAGAGWQRRREDGVSALVIQGRDPRTGEVVGDPLADTTPKELDEVLDAAARAAGTLRGTSPGERAAWLRAVAAAIEAVAPELVALAEAETGLPQPRLAGEV